MRLLLCGAPLGFLLWTPSHCSESVNINHLGLIAAKTNKYFLNGMSHIVSFALPKKLPNPVFSRLLKEVARRDEIITKHLNNYKVSKTNAKD